MLSLKFESYKIRHHNTNNSQNKKISLILLFPLFNNCHFALNYRILGNSQFVIEWLEIPYKFGVFKIPRQRLSCQQSLLMRGCDNATSSLLRAVEERNQPSDDCLHVPGGIPRLWMVV